MRDSGVDIDILLTRPQTNLCPSRGTHMWMPVRVRDARARSLATIEDCKGAKAAKGGDG